MNQTQNNWKRKTLLFLASQCITLFGSMIVQMSIIWYVTLKTSSGGWVAAFTICSYLPQFLISFFAGVWADRYSRKKLIILADGVITVATLVMFLVMPMISSDFVLLSALLVISIIRSMGAGVQTPAVNAVIPHLVPEEHLMRYNGINQTVQSIVQFAAPAVAGTILSIGTFRSTLFIDILTALVGIGLLSCVILPKQKALNENMSVLSEIKAGIRYSFSDKIIGKIYPIFGIILILMALGIIGGIFFNNQYTIPEFTFSNLHPKNLPVWPFMCITVACGAISGFHATQSPMVAKCIKKEKDGKPVFFGAMISEGIIALIWAAAGVAFYGATDLLHEALSVNGASDVVYEISKQLLGTVGGILAIIGVVACPITSGDTAFRSARLILAEIFNLDQKVIKNR